MHQSSVSLSLFFLFIFFPKGLHAIQKKREMVMMQSILFHLFQDLGRACTCAQSISQNAGSVTRIMLLAMWDPVALSTRYVQVIQL